MRNAIEMQEELSETGSIAIGSEIDSDRKIVIQYLDGLDLYQISNRFKRMDSRMEHRTELPSTEKLNIFIDAVQTATEWAENGYASLRDWSYQSDPTRWESPNGNYISIEGDSQHILRTVEFGELYIDDATLGISSTDPQTELYASLFLHSTAPDKFDYVCEKNEHIYNKLTEIHGIGDSIAKSLIQEGCKTYADVRKMLPETSFSSTHLPDAKEEISKHESNKHLLDPEIEQKYSHILTAENI